MINLLRMYKIFICNFPDLLHDGSFGLKLPTTSTAHKNILLVPKEVLWRHFEDSPIFRASAIFCEYTQCLVTQS